MHHSLLATKIALLQKQKIEIEAMRLNAEKAMQDAQAEANSHIGAMASRYDTFKEEAQYLVEGQKRQIVVLTDQIQQYEQLLRSIQEFSYDRVMLGSCVTLKQEDQLYCFFITPVTSDDLLLFTGHEYRAISYKAPLISPFIGKKKGEYIDDINHQLADYIVFDIL